MISVVVEDIVAEIVERLNRTVIERGDEVVDFEELKRRHQSKGVRSLGAELGINATILQRLLENDGVRIRPIGAPTGAEHPRWRGGVTSHSSRERGRWYSRGGSEWVIACCERDDYTCQRCGRRADTKDDMVHVHHKAPFAEYPEQRSAVQNGICLCSVCHWWIHSNDGKATRLRWEREALRTPSMQQGRLFEPEDIAPNSLTSGARA